MFFSLYICYISTVLQSYSCPLYAQMVEELCGRLPGVDALRDYMVKNLSSIMQKHLCSHDQVNISLIAV